MASLFKRQRKNFERKQNNWRQDSQEQRWYKIN